MGTGETCFFQLRRIGPSATCMNISDNMKLKTNGITKFGRATSNDFYLDSTKLKNFISRIHAEIHCITNEAGEIQFKIFDKGLNGTFINDKKMNGPYILKEGDKVTFGHTNGYKLKPGDVAKQPNSEFQFLFEKKVQKEEERGFRTGDIASLNGHSPSYNSSSANMTSNHGNHSIKKSPSKPITDQTHRLSKDATFAYKQSPLTDDTKYSGDSDSRDGYSRSYRHNTQNVRSYDNYDSDGDMDSSPAPLGCKNSDDDMDSSPASDVHKNPMLSSAIHKTSANKVKKSPKNNRSGSENGFTNLGDMKTKLKNGEMKSFRVNINMDSDLKDRNDDRKNQNENVTPPSHTQLEIPSISRRKILPLSSKKRTQSSSSDDSNDLPSPDGELSRDAFNFTSEESSSDMKNNNKKKIKTAKSNAKTSKPVAAKSNKKETAKETGRKRKQSATKDTKPKNAKRGRPPKNKKPRKDSDDSDNDDVEDIEEEELEEGVEWFEEEKCASSECKRPKGKRVGWVCCDDCDEWYHTACVGCRYDHVKDSDIKFSCGCQ